MLQRLFEIRYSSSHIFAQFDLKISIFDKHENNLAM
jgi:hypothetical protein